MYTGTYLDRQNDRLYVVERINGQRCTTEYPLVLEYYLEDENGYYEALNGKRLKKITYNHSNQTTGLKKQYLESCIKTYELGFNLTHKVLYKYYNKCKSPDLHKSFLDIEVDLASQPGITIEKLIEKANCPINAISIYNNWQDTEFTLMLCPPEMDFDEAQKICNEFPNTVLFKEEKDLLEGIILLLDDSDVIAGWNSCIRTDSSVWLKDRIVKIKDLIEGQELYDSVLKKKSEISTKDEYKLSTILNNKIYASNEHKFPVSVYEPLKYVSKSGFENNMKDLSVEDIIKEQQKGNVIFLKLKRGNNTNKDMTYRDYIINNFDWVVKHYNICFSKMSIKMDCSKSKTKQKCYDRIKDYVLKEEMIKYINSNDELKIFSYGTSGNFTIDLNEVVDTDLLHVSGLIYTDGTLYKNGISFYNKDKGVIDKVSEIFSSLYKLKKEKENPYKLYKGVYRRRISLNNKLGLLRGFYSNDTKCIDTMLLSQLSKKQFMSFWSGCIDGDGWVSNSIDFCNYNNDISKFQELLLWNGIVSSINDDENNLHIKSCDNDILKNDMNLWIDYKQHNLMELNTSNSNISKSKALETNYKEYDEIYVRLNPVEKTGNKVDMIDICTSTEYFYSSGIKTHNCGFDYPYIVRRIENVLGKGESKRLNVWNIEPYYKEVEQFGHKKIEYMFYGKWFTDYLLLYKKHATSVKESYKLDNIAFDELGERKVTYSGSLDDLYRENYRLFIEYNRQDTMLVKKLEDKMKYIDIHNRQAHDIKCTIEATMGTVAWVDQAMINEAHDNGFVVQDLDEHKNDEYQGIIPPGAYVADPTPGLCDWIFSFDMNSLYPTTMRSLNLSPECIVGQLKMTLTQPHLWKKITENSLWKNVTDKTPDWGAAWGGDDLWGTLEYQEVMKQSDTIIDLQIEGGPTIKKPAKEIYNMIFADNSNLSISAFGTIFRTDKKGLLNIIFTRWYSDRKKFKKKKEHFTILADGIKIEDEDFLKSLKLIDNDSIKEPREYDIEKLKELIKNKDASGLEQFIHDNDMKISDGIVESKHKSWLLEQVNYWDLEQYVKKIQLNSSYGALLNANSVFYDFRLGCSTTLSGRKVVQHLTAKANELMIGEYTVHGHCQQYNDTDSVYCSIGNEEFRQKHPDFDFSKDNVKEYADMIGDKINDSFPQYMKDTFHCTDEGANLQKAGREVVATRGLFVSKKRYALLIFDKDGFRVDTHGKPGKLKIMGLQIQRSDTPMLVRTLLKNMMMSLLTDGSKDKLIDIIRKFKNDDWNKLLPWEKGTPKAVNKLNYYNDELKKDLKARVPGHVLASINWNRLVDAFGDKVSPKIMDGDKVLVCKIKLGNQYGLKSIALPRDINTVPKWFKSLPFDEQSMKDSVVDKTMDSIFGVLNWGLSLGLVQEENEELNSILTFC